MNTESPTRESDRHNTPPEVGQWSSNLDTVTGRTKVGLACLDARFNFVWVNSVYAELDGRDREEFAGQNHFELYPHEENQAIFERVRDTGVQFDTKEKPFVYPQYPERGVTYWDWTLAPIEDESGNVRWLMLCIVDVTQIVRARQEGGNLWAEQEREFLVHLLRLANRNSDLHTIAKTVVDYLREWSGCEAAALRIRKGRDYPYFYTRGFSDEFVSAESRLCALGSSGEMLLDEEGKPALECVCGSVILRRFDPERHFFTERGSFWTNSTTELVANAPDNDPFLSNARGRCVENFQSVALIPLRAAGTTYGLLQINDRQRDKFSPRMIELLEEVSNILSNVAAREQAREELESAAEFPRQNPNPVMRVSKDGIMLHANHSSRILLDLWQCEEGKLAPEFLRDPALRALSSNTNLEVDLECRGRHFSFVFAPIRERGYVNTYGRDVTDRVERERQREEMLEREHRIAEVLQQAIVPDIDCDIPGCDVAVIYEPALAEAEIGGDFYDIFDLGGGKVAILIGDVAGKGLSAAIRVAAARHAIRSYAYLDPRPSRVLTLANDALCRNESEERGMLTALFAVVDAEVGVITYASGGHEPPLLRHPDGTIEELRSGGRALAVREGYSYSEEGRILRPGDTIVMVTDGITEARLTSDMLFGIEGVRAYLATTQNASATATASGLLDAAKAYAGGRLKDDTAIVVFRFDSARSSP